MDLPFDDHSSLWDYLSHSPGEPEECEDAHSCVEIEDPENIEYPDTLGSSKRPRENFFPLPCKRLRQDLMLADTETEKMDLYLDEYSDDRSQFLCSPGEPEESEDAHRYLEIEDLQDFEFLDTLGGSKRPRENLFPLPCKRLRQDTDDSDNINEYIFYSLHGGTLPNSFVFEDDSKESPYQSTPVTLSQKEKNKAHLKERQGFCQALERSSSLSGNEEYENAYYTLKPHEVLYKFAEKGLIPQKEIKRWIHALKPENRPDLMQRIRRAFESRGIVHSAFYDDFLSQRHRIDQHKSGRKHTMPAVFYLMAAAILCEDREIYAPLALDPLELSLQEQLREEFHSRYSQTLLSEKVSRMHAKHPHLKSALFLCYRFLHPLMELLPLKGHLEVLLLIVSCLEGRGVHHQRSGKNLSFPAKCYRILLETMGPNGKSLEDLKKELPMITKIFE